MKRIAFQWLVISSLLATTIVEANARTRPRYGGTLRVETAGPLWNLNGIARALTTETLTRVDELGRVQPWLAIKWEAQDHNKRWLFTIRPGVRFHDGTTFTPSAVAESFNECAGCPWRAVQVSGDAVVFDLDSPAPLFPALLATSQFAVARSGLYGAPIGTGPMRVQQATPNSATLVSFDGYWNSHGFLDSIEITAGRKPRDQSLDLSVGRTDVTELPAEQVKRAQQDHLRVIASRNDELIVLVMNNASSSIQNTAVRQAVAETVDRASLLNFIFQKQGELAGSLLPNWMTGYSSLFSVAQNLPHAKELRSQAGQVLPLTLTYDPADPSMQLVAERIALSARDAGIAIRTTPAPAHWDLTLHRIRLDSFDPSVALEDAVAAIGLERKAPDGMTVDTLYQRERELLSTYRIVPLLYVPRGFATVDRVHNWKLDELGLPAFLDLWTEVRK
jgi:ABC-type transport system substrate-binding protein